MPTRELVLNAVLRIGLDEKGAAKGLEAFKSFRSEMTRMGTQATELRGTLGGLTVEEAGQREIERLKQELTEAEAKAKKLSEALQQATAAGLPDTSEEVQRLAAGLKQAQQQGEKLRKVLQEETVSSLGEQGLQRMQDDLEKLQGEMTDLGDTVGDQLDRAFRDADHSLMTLDRLGGNLYQAANALQEIGTALTFRDQLMQFEQFSTESDKVGQKYRALNNELAQFQTRTGRVVAQAWIPILERTSSFQERLTQFVEGNPKLLEAAVNIGSAVSTIGELASTIGRGLRIYTDLKQVQISTTQLLAAQLMQRAAAQQLAAATGMESAAATQAAGAATGGTAAAAGGAAAAAGGGGLLSKVTKSPAFQVAGMAAGLGAILEFFKGLNEQFQQSHGLANLEEFDAAVNRMTETTSRLPESVRSQQDFIDQQRQAYKALGDTASALAPATSEGLAKFNNYVDGLERMADGVDENAKHFDNATEALLYFNSQLDDLQAELARGLKTPLLPQIGQMISGAMGQVLRGAAGTQLRNDPAVQAFAQVQQQIAQSEEQYGDQLEKINTDTQEQMIDDQLRFQGESAKAAREFYASEGKQRTEFETGQTKAVLGFAEEEGKTETGYYKDRAKQAEAFGLEMARMEQDYQVQRVREAEDHGRTLQRLAISRDALAVADEIKNYEISRRREEEDHQKEVGRRNEDWARQLAEQEAAFAEQRTSRLADFQKQQQEEKDRFEADAKERQIQFAQQEKERRENYQRQQDERKRQQGDDLRNLQQQHQAEQTQINSSWTDRRRDLGLWLNGEQDQWNTYYRNVAQGLQDMISGVSGMIPNTPLPTEVSSGGTTTPPIGQGGGRRFGGYAAYQEGGYTPPTSAESILVRLHPHEYVLSPETTTHLERVLHSRLDQQRIIQAVQLANAAPSHRLGGYVLGGYTERDRTTERIVSYREGGYVERGGSARDWGGQAMVSQRNITAPISVSINQTFNQSGASASSEEFRRISHQVTMDVMESVIEQLSKD